MAISPDLKRTLERIYWIIGPFLLGITCYVVWKQRKQVQAVLLFIIGLSALFYYWIKYFKVKVETMPWPPYISPCPDYLTLVSPISTGASGPVCMDFVGVSREPRVFKKILDPTMLPQASDVNFNDYAFRLEGTGAGAEFNEEKSKALCGKVNALGLTWAGVCE